MEISSVAVIGASGFVGSHVVRALREAGCEIREVSAPRLPKVSAVSAQTQVRAFPDVVEVLAGRIGDCQAVVNAAGLASATSHDEDAAIAANAVLPGLIGRAAHGQGIRRFVHVSSAAVQGRTPMLDATTSIDPFSAYSRSKALGERFANDFGPEQTVIYRPAGVHGRARAVTRSTARLARSRFSCVAGGRERNTPQALAENVGDAIAFLATTSSAPPRIVTHPSEHISTVELLELLGHRTPALLPEMIASGFIRAGYVLASRSSSMAAFTRRLEMLWFGQEQAESWLTRAGWIPPLPTDEWRRLSDSFRKV